MLVKSVIILPASIKAMNPLQKYPRITELIACTRKILAIMFLLPTNSLVSSGTFSGTCLHKQFQFWAILLLLRMSDPLFFWENYFSNKHH